MTLRAVRGVDARTAFAAARQFRSANAPRGDSIQESMKAMVTVDEPRARAVGQLRDVGPNGPADPVGGARLRHDDPRERVDAERPSPGLRRERLPTMLQGLEVLVVDDDAETASLFKTVLTLYGATVSTAAGAREALRMLGVHAPHVVLSDIAMPGEDGYWLLQEIRRLPDDAVRRVPVVAATAYGREHSRARTMAAGFADHLQKPVDPELLCRTVARAAGR
jgi:CheY-like chemotaxis protein